MLSNAYKRGFIKAAGLQGICELTASQLFAKQSSLQDLDLNASLKNFHPTKPSIRPPGEIRPPSKVNRPAEIQYPGINLDVRISEQVPVSLPQVSQPTVNRPTVNRPTVNRPTVPRQLKIANYYHGSQTQGLKELNPNKHKVIDNEEGVFATPDKRFALAMAARQATINDVAVGYYNKNFYMDELKPGAFKAYDQPGSLYHLANKGFNNDPRLMRVEVVSKNKTPVLKEEAIANLLEALKKHKVNMVEYDKVPEAMKARGMTGIPKHTNKSIKKAGNVIAHIGGATGSGKTHILEALKAKYPHLNTKDLDEFDEQGEKDLGYKHIRKKDYTDEMLASLAKKRQELMDQYIGSNDNIVLGGHHTEADHVLSIPTNNKMLLDRGPLRSSIQGYIRSQISGQHPRSIFDLRSDYAEANDTIRDLKKENYKPHSYNDILNNNMFKKEAMLRGFYKRAQELNKLARGTDEKPGLWANIRAKKQRGESTATPGDKDYPDTKSWNKVTAISEKKASAAWQRSEGKNPSGGLNAKGVASYRAENPGSKLQMAVTTEPSKLDPDSESAKRRKSFCARMSGMPGPMKDDKGRPTRKSLALSKWNC